MEIEAATKDMENFVRRRMEQLSEELGRLPPNAPLSVSFDAEMKIRAIPKPIPEIKPGFYRDRSDLFRVEVIAINHGSGMVQIDVHVNGESELTGRYELISSGLFALMFVPLEEGGIKST